MLGAWLLVAVGSGDLVMRHDCMSLHNAQYINFEKVKKH